MNEQEGSISQLIGRHPEIKRMLEALMDYYIEKERFYLEASRDLSEVNFTQGKIAAYRGIKRLLERRNDG